MIIQSAQVAMKGYSSYQRTETLEIRSSISSELREINRTPSKAIAYLPAEEGGEGTFDQLDLSNQGLELAKMKQGISYSGNWQSWQIEIRKSIVEKILEQLQAFRDGQKGQSKGPDQKTPGESQYTQTQPGQTSDFYNKMREIAGQGSRGFMGFTQGQKAGLLVNVQNITTSRSVSIENSMQFQSSAVVKTADGREINVNLSLSMSQSFYEKHEASIQSVLVDPLVINVGATSAQLSDMKFDFDLDSDGTVDQISQLASGSGFLALDKNGDGSINDGSELFGARTGDGFAELAAYDSDKNGWIDEADDIFNKLRIWFRDEEGNSTLVGLGQAGVGAIFLGNVSTDYGLGALNNPDGVIRSTGMFLYENGQAGTIQHVDLAI